MKIDTSKKSKGLGDSIAKVTNALGINKVADAIAKLAGAEGCGCEERKQYLNELFPYDDSTRKFEVLLDFDCNGQIYRKGESFEVVKNDKFYANIIWYVSEGFIKEI